MFSNKVQTLSVNDLDRYREKIRIVGGNDPYTFKYDAKLLPITVDYDKILSYLLNTISFRTGEPVRNRKSLESFKSFERGFVKEVKGCKYGSIFAVFGKVLHSMRIRDPPAECWILIQDDNSDEKEAGDICAAHCDCTAGAGETCSHVAAVLYALCYARDTCVGNKLSVTQLPAYWTQPSGSSAQNDLYKPVETACFGRTVETFCDLRDYSIEKSEDELKNLISQMKSSGQDIAAAGAFIEPSNLDIDDDDVRRRAYAETTLCFDSIYEDELGSQSLEELIELGRGIIWRFSAEDCDLVEELTREQSSDPLWFKLRYGRVTASTFSKCVKTNIQRPSITLIKSICGVGINQEFPATLYGKQNEHKAIAAAAKIFKQEKHDNFKGRKCGLVISPDYPYFAASPDFIFECDCCKLVVVEAKCPFKFDGLNRDEGINSLLSRQHPYITQDSEGNIAMNHKHEYYFQIQMQMFLTKAAYGIFVVWAPKFTLFMKEQKDCVFWEENEEKAVRFFQSVLTPEILNHYFTCPRLPQ